MLFLFLSHQKVYWQWERSLFTKTIEETSPFPSTAENKRQVFFLLRTQGVQWTSSTAWLEITAEGDKHFYCHLVMGAYHTAGMSSANPSLPYGTCIRSVRPQQRRNKTKCLEHIISRTFTDWKHAVCTRVPEEGCWFLSICFNKWYNFKPMYNPIT